MSKGASDRARALGVAAPTIDALYALVHAADLRRRGILPSVGEGEPGP